MAQGKEVILVNRANMVELLMRPGEEQKTIKWFPGEIEPEMAAIGEAIEDEDLEDEEEGVNSSASQQQLVPAEPRKPRRPDELGVCNVLQHFLGVVKKIT